MKTFLTLLLLVTVLNVADCYAQGGAAVSSSPWTWLTLKEHNKTYIGVLKAPLITREVIDNGVVLAYVDQDFRIVQLPHHNLERYRQEAVLVELTRTLGVVDGANRKVVNIPAYTTIDFEIGEGEIIVRVHSDIFNPPEWQLKVRYVVIPGEIRLIEMSSSTVALGHGESIDGEWTFRLTSSGGTVISGELSLSKIGETVIGDLKVQDGTKTQVLGNLTQDGIFLKRDTGLETIQIYNLKKVDSNHFSGSYKNEGVHEDSGTIEFSR